MCYCNGNVNLKIKSTVKGKVRERRKISTSLPSKARGTLLEELATVWVGVCDTV